MAFSTAKPAPTAKEFEALDRQVGWLVVSRWTYRPLRVVTGLFVRKPNTDGLKVEREPKAGRGTIVVTPEKVTGRGAVFLIHGGGYVIGSNKEALIHATVLAKECGVPVFCPAYRLAPQAPFPAGLDDCHQAWTWLVDHAEDFGVDPAKIVVGGISAGGGHAAALVQRLYDEDNVQPAGQLLFYPMVDDRTAARADLDGPRHRVWSHANNVFGWSSYLGQPPGGECPPYASPARREDLSGLPPAWVGVGNADLFLDEDRVYAQRLKDAGVPVDYVEVDGGIHAFDALGLSPLAKAFHRSACAFVLRCLEEDEGK